MASTHLETPRTVPLTVELDGDVAQALFALAGEVRRPAADLAACVLRYGLRQELRRQAAHRQLTEASR